MVHTIWESMLKWLGCWILGTVTKPTGKCNRNKDRVSVFLRTGSNKRTTIMAQSMRNLGALPMEAIEEMKWRRIQSLPSGGMIEIEAEPRTQPPSCDKPSRGKRLDD